METKNTPTPWGLHHGEKYSRVLMKPDSCTDDFIAEVTSDMTGIEYEDDDANRKANAAFIVRACNAHDDVVAALSAIVSDYLGWAKKISTNGIKWDCDTPEFIPALYDQASAALAKARGEA